MTKPSTSRTRNSAAPRQGLGLVVTRTGTDDLLGVIVRDDVRVGPVTNAFLVYLFKPSIKDLAAAAARIGAASLYLPPLITDISPWKKGLFRTTGPVPRLPTLDAIAPTFTHPLNAKLFDLDGAPAQVASPLTGEWAVWTHSGIQAMLEAKR